MILLIRDVHSFLANASWCRWFWSSAVQRAYTSFLPQDRSGAQPAGTMRRLVFCSLAQQLMAAVNKSVLPRLFHKCLG